MKCPKCQFENPEGAKFCNDCGNELELAGPECWKVNPLGSKLCNECGHKLALLSEPALKDLSPDIKSGKIQRFLPGGLTLAPPPDQIEKRKIQDINHRKRAMKCIFV